MIKEPPVADDLGAETISPRTIEARTVDLDLPKLPESPDPRIEDIDPVTRETSTKLDQYQEKVNAEIAERGAMGKAISKYRRNSNIRIATGIATNLIATLVPGASHGVELTKVLTSFLGGGIAGSSIKLAQAESKAFASLNLYREIDQYGHPIYNLEAMTKDGAIDNLTDDELAEIIGASTEVASTKGLQIRSALQKAEHEKFEEKMNKAGWAKEQFFKLQSQYKRLPLVQKFAWTAGMAGLGVIASSAVGGGALGIGLAGILQVGFGFVRSQTNKYEQAYENSDVVELCVQKLNERTAGKDQTDIFEKVNSYRSQTRKSVSRGFWLGGTVGAALNVTTRSIMGLVRGETPHAHAAENSNEAPPVDNNDPAVHTPEAIKSPETPDLTKAVHVKEGYWEANSGVNADRKYAQEALNAYLERTGKHLSHDEFVTARNNMADAWREQGYFDKGDGHLVVEPTVFEHANINPLHEADSTLHEIASGQIPLEHVPETSNIDALHHGAADHTSHNENLPEKVLASTPRETFESATPLSENNTKIILDPNNGYISKELANRIQELIKSGELKYSDIRISNSHGHHFTDLKLHFRGPGHEHEYVGHQMLKSCAVPDTSRSWWSKLPWVRQPEISETPSIGPVKPELSPDNTHSPSAPKSEEFNPGQFPSQPPTEVHNGPEIPHNESIPQATESHPNSGESGSLPAPATSTPPPTESSPDGSNSDSGSLPAPTAPIPPSVENHPTDANSGSLPGPSAPTSPPTEAGEVIDDEKVNSRFI